MRKFVIFALFVAWLGIVASVTPPVIAAESTTTSVWNSPIEGPGPCSASNGAFPYPLMSVLYVTVDHGRVVSQDVVGPNSDDSKPLYRIMPRPLGLSVNPSLWKIIKAKEVAGTTRIYLRNLEDNEVGGVDTTDSESVATLVGYFKVSDPESLKGCIFVCDTNPQAFFDAVRQTYNLTGETLTKSLAKALVEMQNKLPGGLKMSKYLSPKGELDEVFLERVADEVIKLDSSFKLWRASSAEKPKPKCSRQSTTMLILSDTKTKNQQRVVVYSDGTLYWMDSRSLTEREMKN